MTLPAMLMSDMTGRRQRMVASSSRATRRPDSKVSATSATARIVVDDGETPC
jgi:hypothetical protein